MADDLNLNVNLKGNASEFVGATNQAAKAVESLAAKIEAQYSQVNSVVLRTREVVTNTFVGEPVAAVQKYAENLRLVAANANTFVGTQQVLISAVNEYQNNLSLVAQSTNAWSTAQRAFFDSLTVGWTANASLVQQYATSWNDALARVQQKQQEVAQQEEQRRAAFMERIKADMTLSEQNAQRLKEEVKQNQQDMFNRFRQGFVDAQENAKRALDLTNQLQMAVARAAARNAPMQGPQIPAGISQLTNAAPQLSKSIDLVGLFNRGLTSSIASLGAYGYAAVKTFGLVKDQIEKTLNTFNSLGEATYRLKLTTGDTTEQVSALRFAAEMAGVSALSLEMRWAQFSKQLVANGKWVKALGIEYKNFDGTTKSAFQLMGETADVLNRMSDAEKREAAALQLFGRGFKDILPLLAQGSRGMEEFKKQAEKMGLILSDDDIKKQREFVVAQRQMKAAVQSLYFTIGKELAPTFVALAKALTTAISWFVHLMQTSNGVRTAFKLLGAGIVFLINPLAGMTLGLAALVQGFEPVGDAIVWVSNLFGEGLGKGLSVGAKAIQLFGDVFFAMVESVLATANLLTDNVVFRAIFGWTGIEGGVDKITDGITTAHKSFDDAMSGWADDAWSKGGDVAKNLAGGFVDILKKIHLPKLGSSDFPLGWSETGAFDPSINTKVADFGKWGDPKDSKTTKAGGGGSGKNAIREHFKQMVDTARASLNALVEEAKNAKKQMDDTTNAIRDSLRSAFDITTLADETGGGRSGAGMIALFKRRLESMRGFVANVRRLRDMGIPADWLSEIVSAGVDKGAALAQMLVSQPGVLSQLTELRGQMNVETQAAGEMVGQAMFGDKIADAISRSTTYQQQFQKLLLAGKGKGYKPTAEDRALATQSIANSVYMNVGTNADPYDIEKAIAWALKTGVGGVGGGGRGGFGAGGAGGSGFGATGYFNNYMQAGYNRTPVHGFPNADYEQYASTTARNPSEVLLERAFGG